eukprot:INCI17547.2.p1 GENE.INCI17547.2~~INCI17547.2.p1  ORF type:complete len:1738 (+),score=214.24 INCI17547.2:398-5611(+)
MRSGRPRSNSGSDRRLSSSSPTGTTHTHHHSIFDLLRPKKRGPKKRSECPHLIQITERLWTLAPSTQAIVAGILTSVTTERNTKALKKILRAIAKWMFQGVANGGNSIMSRLSSSGSGGGGGGSGSSGSGGGGNSSSDGSRGNGQHGQSPFMVFDCGTDIRLQGDEFDPLAGHGQQLDDFVQQVFRSQVVVFPKTLQELPLQETLRAACTSIHGWLQMKPDNSAVIIAPSTLHACAVLGTYTLGFDSVVARESGLHIQHTGSASAVGHGQQSCLPQEMATPEAVVHERLRCLFVGSDVSARSAAATAVRRGWGYGQIADAFRRISNSADGPQSRARRRSHSGGDQLGALALSPRNNQGTHSGLGRADSDNYLGSDDDGFGVSVLGKNSLQRCLQTFVRINDVQEMRRSNSVLLHPCPSTALPSGLRCGFNRGIRVAPRVYSTTPVSRLLTNGNDGGGGGSPSPRPSLAERFRVRPSRGPPPLATSSGADGTWVVRRIIFNGKPHVSKSGSQNAAASSMHVPEGFRPYVSITQENPSGPHLIYSSMVGGVREYGPQDRFVEFNPNSQVRGEIVLKVFHLSRAGGAKMLFDFGLHTDSFGAAIFSAPSKASESSGGKVPIYWVHMPPFAEYVDNQSGDPLPVPSAQPTPAGSPTRNREDSTGGNSPPDTSGADRAITPPESGGSRPGSSGGMAAGAALNSGYFVRLQDGPGPTCLRHVVRLHGPVLDLKHVAGMTVSIPHGFSIEVEFEYRFAGRNSTPGFMGTPVPSAEPRVSTVSGEPESTANDIEDSSDGDISSAAVPVRSPSATTTVLYQVRCDTCGAPFGVARPSQLGVRMQRPSNGAAVPAVVSDDVGAETPSSGEYYSPAAYLKCPGCAGTIAQCHAIGGQAVVGQIPDHQAVGAVGALRAGAVSAPSSTASSPQRAAASRNGPDSGSGPHAETADSGTMSAAAAGQSSFVVRGRTHSEPSFNFPNEQSQRNSSGPATAAASATANPTGGASATQSSNTPMTAEAALAGLEGLQGGFQVGDHVRALWLGEDRHDWPGWYPATITEAFRDGTFSLLYDDGYRGRKVPAAAIQAALSKTIPTLQEMFPSVPPRVLATYVSRADETGASLDELVQQIMELLERYAISRGRNRGNVPHIGTSASTGATNRQGVPLSPLLRTRSAPSSAHMHGRARSRSSGGYLDDMDDDDIPVAQAYVHGSGGSPIHGDVVPQLAYIEPSTPPFGAARVSDSGATSEASSAASSATNSPMLQFLANGSVVAAPGATQAALESMLAAAGIAASGAATARTEGTPDALDLPPPANHTNNAGTIHNASATDTADDRPDAMPLLSLGPGANETSAGSISDSATMRREEIHTARQLALEAFRAAIDEVTNRQLQAAGGPATNSRPGQGPGAVIATPNTASGRGNTLAVMSAAAASQVLSTFAALAESDAPRWKPHIAFARLLVDSALGDLAGQPRNQAHNSRSSQTPERELPGQHEVGSASDTTLSPSSGVQRALQYSPQLHPQNAPVPAAGEVATVASSHTPAPASNVPRRVVVSGDVSQPRISYHNSPLARSQRNPADAGNGSSTGGGNSNELQLDELTLDEQQQQLYQQYDMEAFVRDAERHTRSAGASASVVNSLPVSAYEGSESDDGTDVASPSMLDHASTVDTTTGREASSGELGSSSRSSPRIRRSMSAGVTSTICHQCSICQENFQRGDAVKTLPCQHGYHLGCIDSWLHLKNACPVCMLPVG